MLGLIWLDFISAYSRNFMHDDITCPYDMHDGWQFFDNQTGQWIHDESLQVLCVGHDVF